MKKVDIDISKVGLLRERPRSKFVESELIETMERHGLILPISVKQEGDHYVCFMGQGRLEAARKLHKKVITAYVYEENEITGKEMVMKYFVDNSARPKISSVSKYEDIASKIRRGAKIETLTKKYGISKATLKKGVKAFEKASNILKNANRSGLISGNQLVELSRIKNDEAHEEIIRLLQEKYYSKRDKDVVIAIANKLDSEHKAITANNIRKEIENVNTELFSLKDNNSVKRNRLQLLNEYHQALQKDNKFMELIKQNSITFTVVA